MKEINFNGENLVIQDANTRDVHTETRLVEALKRARQDLIDIKEDCDSGEFEIDPQFAIDRITETLNQ